jgi:hypothetical protein
MAMPLAVPATSASPPAAITPERQAFWSLERWLLAGDSTWLPLREIEREARCRGREVLRLLVQAHIRSRGDGDVGRALRVRLREAFPRLYTHKRLHTRRLVTLFGPITIQRMGYSLPGRPSIHPLDAELQLPARRYSYEVQRLLVKAALQGPFDEALGSLRDTLGIRVPKRTAEQLVLEASADVESFYRERQGPIVEPACPILVAAIDSKGIPMVKIEPANRAIRLRKGQKRQKKRMATVAAVFNQASDLRTPESVVASLFAPAGPRPDHERQKRTAARRGRKRVWASLVSEKDAFVLGVREEMLRRDPQHSRTWVIVTDGERGLQHRVCRIFQDITLVLDLLHVLEKLWKAAHVFHGEGSAQAEDFVRSRALRILRGQVSQVVKGLRQMVTKRRLHGDKRDTLLGVAAYFYRNRTRMQYHLYLEKGWPIASGSVEGACKNLIKDRMERSGMRWTPAMAEAMLRLRATHLSGDFDEYWDYHVQQDQLRLHPPDVWRVVEK